MRQRRILKTLTVSVVGKQRFVARHRRRMTFLGDKKCLCNSYIIFIIIVAIILINKYYGQVYIAQIMKLDVNFHCYLGKKLPTQLINRICPRPRPSAMSCQKHIQIYLLHPSLSAHCRFYIVIPFNSLLYYHVHTVLSKSIISTLVVT